ncbi:hypothetical protein G443_004398 [Actinoalloteichus cyanogriseus DSM 43889]|uniref:Basic proline-rich protein n=1 Tax=Actinoalloteichus caeruleus DSM 43889 TaxID=1120930 RepID=A0ABT1JNM2_ACTCY|nr:hypothetical protein [Actinoalloteichus caeruleus DSM 43889]
MACWAAPSTCSGASARRSGGTTTRPLPRGGAPGTGSSSWLARLTTVLGVCPTADHRRWCRHLPRMSRGSCPSILRSIRSRCPWSRGRPARAPLPRWPTDLPPTTRLPAGSWRAGAMTTTSPAVPTATGHRPAPPRPPRPPRLRVSRVPWTPHRPGPGRSGCPSRRDRPPRVQPSALPHRASPARNTGEGAVPRSETWRGHRGPGAPGTSRTSGRSRPEVGHSPGPASQRRPFRRPAPGRAVVRTGRRPPSGRTARHRLVAVLGRGGRALPPAQLPSPCRWPRPIRGRTPRWRAGTIWAGPVSPSSSRERWSPTRPPASPCAGGSTRSVPGSEHICGRCPPIPRNPRTSPIPR